VNQVHFASYYRWLVAIRYWGLPRQFGEPVLDIGAGDGYFLSQLQAAGKVGVDIAVAESPLAPMVQAKAQRLPFPASTFGHVLAFDVLEHVLDDRTLLVNIERVLRPGGILWLSTPAHRFRVFPGGAVQNRLCRSWGHVRQGYSASDLVARLPGNMEGAFFYWNEPVFRVLYLALKALDQVRPAWTPQFIRWIAGLDARYRKGESGHLFARVVKLGVDA